MEALVETNTEEVEIAYQTAASTAAFDTAYMTYAFDTSVGSRRKRLELLVMYAPTLWESRELTTAFASEGIIPDDEVYHRELTSRWLKAELGATSGKPEWLAAIGFQPVRVSFRMVAGPIDRDAISRAIRGEDPPAPPPSFSERLLRGITAETEARRKQRESRRQANRAEQAQLDELARRRRRRLHGGAVAEQETEVEREALLASATKHWTPEMRRLVLEITSVKIFGMHVLGILKNPLLSVEEKQRKIGEAKAPSLVPLPSPDGFNADAVRAVLKQMPNDEEKDLVSVSGPTAYPTAFGPASPWPLWPNLQLVEDELQSIYTKLANLRVAFRKAEAEATVERDRRERVDEIVFRDDPRPWQNRAARKIVARYNATKPDPVRLDKAQYRAELTTAQVARERARVALAVVQRAPDPAVRERAAAEAQSFLKIARAAARKVHTRNFQVPVKKEDDRR